MSTQGRQCYKCPLRLNEKEQFRCMALAMSGENVLCEGDGFVFAKDITGLVPVAKIAKNLGTRVSTVMSRAICRLPVTVWTKEERCDYEESMTLYVHSGDVPQIMRALASH